MDGDCFASRSRNGAPSTVQPNALEGTLADSANGSKEVVNSPAITMGSIRRPANVGVRFAPAASASEARDSRNVPVVSADTSDGEFDLVTTPSGTDAIRGTTSGTTFSALRTTYWSLPPRS